MKNLLSTHFYFIAILLFFNTISLHAQKISMDRNWKFHLGDVPFPVIQGHGMTYENAKAVNVASEPFGLRPIRDFI